MGHVSAVHSTITNYPKLLSGMTRTQCTHMKYVLLDVLLSGPLRCLYLNSYFIRIYNLLTVKAAEFVHFNMTHVIML